MVLEATMIVVDNSESSRNGDYMPTRWEAQADAVNMIFSAKTQSNPESSVGLMNMAGAGPEVLVTLTTDFGKVLEGIHRTKIKGHGHLTTAIQVAALALKHRENKSQRPRIIIFICSPIHEDESTLNTLALKMRKLNISIDLIAFGHLAADATAKLQSFNEKLQGGDGSHLALIQPGGALLSDQLISTPILAGDGVVPRSGDADMSMGDGGDGGGAGGFEFGVDPSTDPELALALRMSMEEEKARQESSSRAAAGPSNEPTLENIAEEHGTENEPLLANTDEVAKKDEEVNSTETEAKSEAKDKDKSESGEGADQMDTS